MESREKDKTALSAKFTLSDCNPDCNPATKSESTWVPFESQLNYCIWLKIFCLVHTSLFECNWAKTLGTPCKRAALPLS